jgi:hypothetical protein
MRTIRAAPRSTWLHQSLSHTRLTAPGTGAETSTHHKQCRAYDSTASSKHWTYAPTYIAPRSTWLQELCAQYSTAPGHVPKHQHVTHTRTLLGSMGTQSPAGWTYATPDARRHHLIVWRKRSDGTGIGLTPTPGPAASTTHLTPLAPHRPVMAEPER